MYDNIESSDELDISDPSTPTLPIKQSLRRKAPLFGEQDDFSEGTKTKREHLEKEIEKLMSELERSKKVSSLQKRTIEQQNEGEKTRMESSLACSINKLCRPKVFRSELPIFDGTGSKSFKSFLREFEDLAKLGEWTNKEKLAVLPSILDKRPKMFFHRLTSNRKSTFESAISELKVMFDAPEDNVIRRRKLHSIRQDDKPLLEFLEELEYLFTELEIPENLQLDYLTAALRNDLQDFICVKQYKSYEDAVRALKLKESLRKKKPLDAQLKMICDRLSAIEESFINNQRNSNVGEQANVEEIMREIDHLKQRIERIEQSNLVHQKYKRSGRTGQSYSFFCWNCGKPGHKASTCRFKP